MNLIRWSILAGMLAFLLTSILALHEAPNFQDRVLELAGNDRDRARRVLGILHDTLENPGSYPEDRELPYASIAVKLDRLSKVQATLTGFHLPDIPPREDPATVIAKQQWEAAGQERFVHEAAASPDPVDQWKAASNRLKLSIADLDDTLKTGDPARKLVDALDVTRRRIQVLKAFTGSVEIAEGGLGSAPFGIAHAGEGDELSTETKRFQLQQVTEDLANGLIRLKERVTTSPEDELLVAQLDRLQREIGRLELFFNSSDLKISEAPVEPSEATWAPIGLVVEGIDHRINEIESILLQIDDGFVAAAKLADLIVMSMIAKSIR